MEYETGGESQDDLRDQGVSENVSVIKKKISETDVIVCNARLHLLFSCFTVAIYCRVMS